MKALPNLLSLSLTTLALLACGSTKPTTRTEPLPAAATAPHQPEVHTAPVANPPSKPATATLSTATIGSLAPAFSLPDLDGKVVSLAKYKGKAVVLEWFNPECPFVKKAHTTGSLAGAAERQIKNGVVWLAINSGAPGRQGHGVEPNRQGKEGFKLSHPVLLDEDGSVGRQYGAERTPHMFVIAPTGELAYRGAIDNSPDGEGESPEGGKLVNYVEEALTAIQAGKKPDVAETEAYGCSVKYAK